MKIFGKHSEGRTELFDILNALTRRVCALEEFSDDYPSLMTNGKPVVMELATFQGTYRIQINRIGPPPDQEP